MKITVLGAGGWELRLPSFVRQPSRRQSLDVWQWSSRPHSQEAWKPSVLPGVVLPSEIKITTDIEASCRERDMIVAAVPSQFFVPFSNALLISIYNIRSYVCCQGHREWFLDDHVWSFIGCAYAWTPWEYAILSGPSHAEEVSLKIPTMVVSASFNWNSKDCTGSVCKWLLPRLCERRHSRCWNWAAL